MTDEEVAQLIREEVPKLWAAAQSSAANPPKGRLILALERLQKAGVVGDGSGMFPDPSIPPEVRKQQQEQFITQYERIKARAERWERERELSSRAKS